MYYKKGEKQLVCGIIFEESRPMTGQELELLEEYFNNTKKSAPTLPNRI